MIELTRQSHHRGRVRRAGEGWRAEKVVASLVASVPVYECVPGTKKCRAGPRQHQCLGSCREKNNGHSALAARCCSVMCFGWQPWEKWRTGALEGIKCIVFKDTGMAWATEGDEHLHGLHR